MMNNINQYLNKTIMVSIPALFEDGKCRPFKLLSVDVVGLWLESDELAMRLLPEQFQLYVSTAPIVFVPFAQIAGVLIPTKAAATQSSELEQVKLAFVREQEQPVFYGSIQNLQFIRNTPIRFCD